MLKHLIAVMFGLALITGTVNAQVSTPVDIDSATLEITGDSHYSFAAAPQQVQFSATTNGTFDFSESEIVDGAVFYFSLPVHNDTTRVINLSAVVTFNPPLSGGWMTFDTASDMTLVANGDGLMVSTLTFGTIPGNVIGTGPHLISYTVTLTGTAATPANANYNTGGIINFN